MNENNILDLIEKAKTASQHSYSPYSHFTTGAALLTSSGKIYTGCNVENSGIQSICAERVAFTKAISEGEKSFQSIAVVGKFNKDLNFEDTLPCGYCRQFISEFCSSDFKIYTNSDITGKIHSYSLAELLPHSFHL